MLRDRTPKLVSFALKWCKVKEAWLDHVYKNWIWLYVSNKERLEATKRILGYTSNNKREFKFEDTIAWDSLSPDETSEWESVAKWVSWFQSTVPYIENEYNISKKKGVDIIDIKRSIMINHLYDYLPTKEDSEKTRKKKNLYVNTLTDYLIDCFEQM